jgi:hypothetical protein
VEPVAVVNTVARPSRKQVVRGILPQNVRVLVVEGDKSRRTASGVVIGTERTDKGLASYVITNAHAVDLDDLKNPRLLITQERQAELMQYPAELVATGKGPKMVKTDAPIGYGASGGGIFSLETGKLLAIVEGYRTAKVGFEVADRDYSFDVPMPGETFAAPTSKVRRFLESKGYSRLLVRGSEGNSAQTAQR